MNKKRSKWLMFWIMVVLGTLAVNANATETLEPYRALAQVDTPAGQGSGSLLSVRDDLGTGLVLSCRHVGMSVGTQVELSWFWAGDQKTKGVVVAIVPGRTFNDDLALIVCDAPKNVKPVHIVPYRPQDGPWILAGYRDGKLRVVEAPASKKQENMILTNRAAIGGMSGGALFNRYGQQVAVVVASDRSSTTISTDGPLLHQFLRNWLK